MLILHARTFSGKTLTAGCLFGVTGSGGGFTIQLKPVAPPTDNLGGAVGALSLGLNNGGGGGIQTLVSRRYFGSRNYAWNATVNGDRGGVNTLVAFGSTANGITVGSYCEMRVR